MVWLLALKKTGMWDRDMAFDIQVQNVLEKKSVWQTVVWPLELKKLGLTDRGVATGVTKFCMASGRLTMVKMGRVSYFDTLFAI